MQSWSQSLLQGDGFLPDLELLLSLCTVLSGGEELSFRLEMRSYQIVNFEKLLGLFR